MKYSLSALPCTTCSPRHVVYIIYHPFTSHPLLQGVSHISQLGEGGHYLLYNTSGSIHRSSIISPLVPRRCCFYPLSLMHPPLWTRLTQICRACDRSILLFLYRVMERPSVHPFISPPCAAAPCSATTCRGVCKLVCLHWSNWSGRVRNVRLAYTVLSCKHNGPRPTQKKSQRPP